MWLSIFSVWGSLITLVASQSCPDPSDHSASWVRLKPLGQCKDGESTCPYRITLPPLTVQLPKSFRELEKMARELHSLTQMVNQLKEDCRECKERQKMDWNIQTDDEGEDGERIQASRGTLNTKERKQGIAKKNSTVQVTTSRSAMEDTEIIISDEKDVNPTAFGKQRNITRDRIINPHTTKPSAVTNGGRQGSNPSQKNLINRSKIVEGVNLAESSFPGDLDSGQPTQHEKHKDSVDVGHEMNPRETMTANGKVKSIPEYHVDTKVTENNDYDDDDDYDDYDDAETKQLQIPKGDKILRETGITGTHFDNEDKKEEADTRIKESRSNNFDDTNNGNVAKEGRVIVTQQSTFKNKGNNGNHSASSTSPKPLKPGVYSERGAEVNSRLVNTADTISGQKKLTLPITDRANASVNVSEINPQTLEIKSKYALKPDTDAKISITIESKMNTAETESGQATTRSPIFDTTYGLVDVSPANPQTDNEKQLHDDTNSTDSETGINLNPVYNVDTISGVKNSRLPNSDKANVKKGVKLTIPQIQKNNFQTPFKDGTDAGSNNEMDSKPVNGLKNSRLPILGITDGTVDVSPTYPQILDSNYRFKVSTDSDAGIDSNPVDNTETVSGLNNSLNSHSPNSDRANATADVDIKNPKRQSSNSQSSFKASKDRDYSTEKYSNPISKVQTVSGQETLKSSISEADDGIDNVSSTNPQTFDSKKQLRIHTDLESDTLAVSTPFNNTDTVNELRNLKSPNSVNATENLNLINTKKQTSSSHTLIKSSKEEEGDIRRNSNPVNKLKNSESPISGKNYSIVDVSPTNPQTVHSKNQVKAATDSKSDARMGLNLASNIEIVRGQKMSRSDGIADENPTNLEIQDNKKTFKTGTDSESDAVSDPYTESKQKNSGSFISDRDRSTADVGFINTQLLNSQTPFTHGIDAKGNSGIDSHPFITSETDSQIQTPNSPISVITDAVEVNQTYPGILDSTFKKQLKPETDAERKAEIDSNPLTKVKTHNQLKMPQLLVTGRADATVKVNKINLHMVNSNSKNATALSTPVNKVDTVNLLEKTSLPIAGRSQATTDQINPRGKDHISKNLLKPGTISETKIYPYQNHSADSLSQQESTESNISDSRHNESDTNPHLNRNDDLPKIQLLPNSKLNVTHTRNGRIRSSNPVSIDTERKQTPRNNKTTLMRNYAMTSGRHLPTGLVPGRLGKQKEITNQPEKNNPTGISLIKDPRRKKTYVLQRRPVNESKAFGSRGPKNTSEVVNYTRNNGTTHVYSKTVSSPNNELKITDEMSQTVMPTFATQGVVYQAHIKSTETAPAIEVLNTDNQLIKSTSQTSVITLDKHYGSSQQDLVLDTVNNIGRDLQAPVVEKTGVTDTLTVQTPLKTSSVDSNQDKHKKQLKLEGVRILVGKMPLAVASSESNKLINPTTTAVTSYTIKTEYKDKQGKMPQFTPPTITTPHFMDQDHAEQANTTSKVSNKHVYHRPENPGQEMESKKSHNDIGTKELQIANNSQGSSKVTDLQPNFQNRTVGSTGIIMDLVTASTGAKVSIASIESTKGNIVKDSTPSAMGKVEASTEVNRETPFLNNDPVTYHRYSKSSFGSSGSREGNNGGHSVDRNNGNSHGHTNNGENKKPLIVNNMDERQGLKNQLFSNCDGDCDLSPTSWSVLNSPEPSNNDRDKRFQDCSDLIMRNPTSGIYNVTPSGSGNRTFPVFCDKSSGGGWTLLQHRFDGSISFNRTWNDYKKGFGNLKGEFWLGNDKIHWLASTRAMVLRIELEDLDGMKEYAQYDHFHVANESQYYRLTIDRYSGTAGDALRYSKKFNHNQKNFTTPDRDNDLYTSGNCGAYYSSGWWFDACMAANLNGKYYKTRYRGVRNGIFWGTWHNISTESYLTHDRQAFKTVRMMIRPRNI